MAKIEQTICDHCKRVKGESNHWFRIFTVQGARGEQMFTVYPTAEGQVPPTGAFDICGFDCLSQELSTFVHETLKCAGEPGVKEG